MNSFSCSPPRKAKDLYVEWVRGDDTLAAIFEAKLNAAIDNHEAKKGQFSNPDFDLKMMPFYLILS